jgi:predicted 2-oxoglutarate/Fe(II)-dependent dioxygenase YbiX
MGSSDSCAARGILLVPKAMMAPGCDVLRELYDEAISYATQKDYSHNPVVHLFDADRHLPTMATVMRVWARQALVQVGRFWPEERPLFVESVFVARIGPGSRHPAHADNCRPNGHGGWEPNHTPQRHLSSLFYLNGDFEGGELRFPALDVEIRPEPGMLVAFPSRETHVHEVAPVTRGLRYSVPVWFTQRHEAAAPGIPHLGL